MHTEKATLRRALKAKRAQLKLTQAPALWGPAQFDNLVHFLTNNLTEIQLSNLEFAAYYPIQSELDLTAKSTPHWLFPRVQNNGELTWFKQGNLLEGPWECTKYGTRERPADFCFPFEHQNGITLVLVPALAVDKWGTRVGYGGGYYDRFINTYADKIITICCVFDDLIEEKLPAETHDVPVDIIVSEKRIIIPKNENQLLCKLRT